ncbi:scavenger receptor class B member 1 isoform X1 [Bemisia tabaci]
MGSCRFLKISNINLMSTEDNEPNWNKLLEQDDTTTNSPKHNGSVGIDIPPSEEATELDRCISQSEAEQTKFLPTTNDSTNLKNGINTHGVNTIQILTGKNKDITLTSNDKKDKFRPYSLFPCFNFSSNSTNFSTGKSEIPNSPLINGTKVYMTNNRKSQTDVNAEWKSIKSHTNSLQKSSKFIPRCNCWLIILYLGLVLTSLLCGVMWFTNVYQTEIAKKLTLYNGSLLMNNWANSSVKPNVCVYAFNYTNADEFLTSNDDKMRLKVQEVGPYCYKESVLRTNVVFNDDDGTVTFSEFRSHEFDEDASRGNKDDLLTLPNVPVIGAISQVKNYNTLYRRGLAFTLKWSENSSPFVKVKAHDYFFGYDDSLVKIAGKIARFLHKEMPFDKFGILAKKSGLNKDRITIQGGYKDLDHFGDVVAVNGVNETDKWKSDDCNAIEGSYGSFFPRKLLQDKSKPLYIYNKDICRKLPLVYKEQIPYQEGMMADVYALPTNVFASPKRNSYNQCFCKREFEISCPDGIFDAAPCSSGFPMVFSQPHFLNADPILVDAVDGLSPNETLHDFKLHIHRGLGITIGSESRIQINIRVSKVPELSILDPFEDDSVLPIVWLEVGVGKIPPKLFAFIHHASVTVNLVEKILKYGSLCVLIIILVLLSHSYFKKLLPWSRRLKMKPTGDKAQTINMNNVLTQTCTIKNKF